MGDAAELYTLTHVLITTCFFAPLTFRSLHAGLFSTRSSPTLWRAAAGRRAARSAQLHSRLAPPPAPSSGPRLRHNRQRRRPHRHRVPRPRRHLSPSIRTPTRAPRAKPRASPLTPLSRSWPSPPRDHLAALSLQSSAKAFLLRSTRTCLNFRTLTC